MLNFEKLKYIFFRLFKICMRLHSKPLKFNNDVNNNNNNNINNKININASINNHINTYNTNSGVVSTAKEIKLTKMQQIVELVVKATDHGDPALSSTAALVIVFVDVNNHHPVFEKDFYR